MTQRLRTAVALVLLAAALTVAVPAAAGAAEPSVIETATGGSAWTYQDIYDVSTKYEGGYAEFDNSGETTYSASPHGGYNTTTNKCNVCHATHRTEGAYYLLRADSQDDACSYCHIGSAHSSKVVYDLNPAGIYTENGHTIGAAAQIPGSSTYQESQAVTLNTTDANGNPVTETIYVRTYSDQKLEMYRFTRHHGQSGFGAGRDGYQKIGPVALRCMNCHQTHGAASQVWRPYAIDPVTSETTTTRSSGYKLLRLFPSGSTTGTPNAYSAYEPGQIVAVPETTLTAGVNFSQNVSAEDVSTDPAFPADTYRQPLWVAQRIGPEPGDELGSRRDANAVNTAALSVWCADCHNLNIGETTSLAPELGFKAHNARTHPAPYVGAFRGPGQCYSCHRNDLPRIATGDACSQCHYGTGNYAKNRQDATHFEYVDSDFPHSGEVGDYKMLGSFSVDSSGVGPPTIDESATVGPGNLDAVCLRCHYVPQSYHDGGSGAGSHDVPAAYADCTVCHNAGNVIDIHATAPDGCYTCHDAPTLTSDCAVCHSDKLVAHGYEAAQHTATPGSGSILIYAAGEHDSAMIGPGEVTVSCTLCHRAEIGPVHDNRCSTCHPAPFDTLSPAWTGGCQQGGCHSTYHDGARTAHWPVEPSCNQCHDAGWNVTAAACPNCHTVYSAGDVTPPVTTSDALASYVGAARIEFSITDSGKVGVGTTYYRIDGGTLQSGSVAVVTTAGAHTIAFWSVDQNGNVETPPKTASFTLTADTTPPVTTSNAVATYYQGALITLTPTDASTQGVKATYYTLNGGATQTGTTVSVPGLSGTIAYTLQFWSEDWSGNVETPKTANFTVTGGTGTLRLVWGDSDILGPPGAGSEAVWTVRRTNSSGAIVATGSGAFPGWSGVDDVVVPVRGTPYWVQVDWWDDYYGYWDQTVFANVYVTTAGQVVRLSY